MNKRDLQYEEIDNQKAREAEQITEAKHSPLPWKQRHPAYYADDGRHIEATEKEIDGSTEIIASYISPANAAFIVRAVNNFEQMLRVLKICHTNCIDTKSFGTADLIETVLKQAEQEDI